jgi:hypothetical protein
MMAQTTQYAMSEPLTDLVQVTPQWLTEVLLACGCLPRGRVSGVQITSQASYTSTLARLCVSYTADAPESAPSRLLLKLSRPDPRQRVVGSEQRRAEVTFHTALAKMMPDPPVAPCHRAVFSEETGASDLLFDDLSATHIAGSLEIPPSREQCERALDAFAAVHAYWWDNPILVSLTEMPDHDSVAAYVASIEAHFPPFVEALGRQLSPGERLVFEKVLAALPALFRRVARGKHLTLIHGDANFSNVLLPRDPAQGRALIIDWQLWGASFAAEDLAHLIALFWNPADRRALERALLRRYYDALVEYGVGRYTWEECWDDYRLAIILRVLFMPMWFWTAGLPLVSVRSRLNNAMQAYAELGCGELLDAGS